LKEARDLKNVNLMQWRGNVFERGGGGDIKYKFRFAPKFAKHQPVISMGVVSCTVI